MKSSINFIAKGNGEEIADPEGIGSDLVSSKRKVTIREGEGAKIKNQEFNEYT